MMPLAESAGCQELLWLALPASIAAVSKAQAAG
jgi:hypothetical protein